MRAPKAAWAGGASGRLAVRRGGFRAPGVGDELAPRYHLRPRMPRLVLLSDTHGRHEALRLPDGDILVHAGDACTHGDEREARAFADWWRRQPHHHKVLVAGNHDRCLEARPELAAELFAESHYLFDSAADVAGLRIFGSPWSPEFMGWAFGQPRGEALARVWAGVPAGIDVLVTHGPPAGVLDRTFAGDLAGCEELARALPRIAPRLHVFGHIHEGAGSERRGTTLFVNASVCTVAYEARNPIRVVELPAPDPALARNRGRTRSHRDAAG